MVMVEPSTWAASMMQDRTGSPSTLMVHAPQIPCSQPTWVPVSRSSSRMKSASSWRAGTTASTASPLTVTLIGTSLDGSTRLAVGAVHAAASSSARCSSTATSWRRYWDDPWMSSHGSTSALAASPASAAAAPSRARPTTARSAPARRTGLDPTANAARRALATAPSAKSTAVATPATAKSPLRRANSRKEHLVDEGTVGKVTCERISPSSSEFMYGPAKNSDASMARSPPALTATMVASSVKATAGSSAAGSA